MKRSEMLEEIRKILALNGKDNGYGELEEAILHHLESLGMEPPFINEEIECNRGFRKFKRNNWESEDEA